MIPERVEGERAVLVPEAGEVGRISVGWHVIQDTALVPEHYAERPIALRSAQLDVLRTAVEPSFAVDAVEQRVELPDAVDELAPTVTPSRLEAQ